MLAFLVLTAILIATMGVIHKSWNARRDKKDATNPEGKLNPMCNICFIGRLTCTDPSAHFENEEFADMTDFQLRSFRYPL
jgi:ACS family allantoate permease-like MFS transporter